MTRGFLSILCLLVAWPLVALAQTVNVRSGEHDTFTRLVFNVPERMEVALRYQPDGVVLAFERAGLTFDTDTVFERVPTTRLTEMTAQDSQMTLTLSCKCAVETFWAGDRAFVVDIGDETVVSAALFPSETAEPIAAPQLTTETFRVDPEPDKPQTSRDRAPMMQAPSVGSVAFLIADAQDRLDELSPNAPAEAERYAAQVRESQGAIIEQIGRAATQGLLSPKESLLPQTPEPVAEQTGLVTVATPEETMPDEGQPDIGQNILLSAQTSVDQALSERIVQALDSTDSSGCLNPARLDTAAWGGEGSFIDQIGPLRSRILGEFDQPSEADILKLVQFYIHFGFGVEARQVGKMLPNGKDLDPVLRAMINILEQGSDGQNSLLAGQMDCEPVVAVWSLLSYETIPGNQPIDPDGIVRGILKLPVHLRAYLGPVVGTKLRQAGYGRAADHVARALIRNDETRTTAAKYLNVHGDKNTPDARPSEAELGVVVAGNAEPSADALLHLINGKLAKNEAISQDMAVLAGAYAMEYRNAAKGADLGRAYVLSMASAGGFAEAYAELDRLKSAGPAPSAGTLSELTAMLAGIAPDPVFLTHAIGADQATRFGLDDEVGNAVASRLMALGFPEAAGLYVAPMANGPAEKMRKLIRAEIALQAQRPRQAELELIGEGGADALQLLARARSMAGEHAAAQAMYTQIDAEDDALRQAWLEGDWQRLQTHSDPTIAAVANRQTEPAPVEDANVAQVLARNTAMIEDSQSMRSEIEALLSGLAVPNALDDARQ